MRIFLDAYFDNNYGDDLFINLLLKRYPDALFYCFLSNTPKSVLDRASDFSNLVILPQGCVMQQNWNYDAYIMIGGDVLSNGIDYSERIAIMRHVKACGGFVALLGFSLYTEYGEKTIGDLRSMAEIADSIVLRDVVSAKRFQSLVPGARVIQSTDMVFTAGYHTKNVEKERVLGIIPRRKLYSTDEEHLAYCQSMAMICDAWLERNRDSQIRFLAYSTGEYDDRVTSLDILKLMSNKVNVELVAYEGNIEQFIKKVASCEALLPTRFHGLVFALIFRIPFVVIPYEVKIEQLLSELCYTGIQVPYGKEITEELVTKVVEGLKSFAVEEEALNAYEEKAKLFFADLDQWLDNMAQSGQRIKNNGLICQASTEIIKYQQDNVFLRKQILELEKWIHSLKQERMNFEKQNLELEQIRKMQAEALAELKDVNTLLQKQIVELTEKINQLSERGRSSE